MSSSRDDHSKFTAVDAEIVGVSMNHPLSQKAFSDFLKLNFPLLTDFPDGKTSQAYGVFNADRRLATRSYFIVEEGVIRYKKVLAPKGRWLRPTALIA